MRIGELASAAGVSTRTVRHYHHVGVLPEPGRTAAGYRTYTLRDLVRLVHARRLVELGLGLDEVADALAGDEGRDLGEIIEAMDAGLAEQAERIAAQRTRLTQLRTRVRDGHLAVDDLGAAALVEFFDRVEAAGAAGPGVRLDRQVLDLLPREEVQRWLGPVLPLLAEPETPGRVAQLYAAFDQLAAVPADDPSVARFVDACLEEVPADYLAALGDVGLEELIGAAVYRATLAQLSGGQAAALHLLVRRAEQAAGRNHIRAHEGAGS